MLTQLILIIQICFPVFFFIILGKILSKKTSFTDIHWQLINWLVYYFSLPAIIFLGISSQPIQKLLKVQVIVGTVLPTFLMFFLFLGVTFLIKIDSKKKPGFIFGVFWANMAYLGLPLALNAFGEEGFTFGTVAVAFGMSTQVFLGILLIGLYSKKNTLYGNLRKTILNPVVCSSFLGLFWLISSLQIKSNGL